jgi:hypothetical protein
VGAVGLGEAGEGAFAIGVHNADDAQRRIAGFKARHHVGETLTDTDETEANHELVLNVNGVGLAEVRPRM